MKNLIRVCDPFKILSKFCKTTTFLVSIYQLHSIYQNFCNTSKKPVQTIFAFLFRLSWRVFYTILFLRGHRNFRIRKKKKKKNICLFVVLVVLYCRCCWCFSAFASAGDSDIYLGHQTFPLLTRVRCPFSKFNFDFNLISALFLLLLLLLDALIVFILLPSPAICRKLFFNCGEWRGKGISEWFVVQSCT